MRTLGVQGAWFAGLVLGLSTANAGCGDAALPSRRLDSNNDMGQGDGDGGDGRSSGDGDSSSVVVDERIPCEIQQIVKDKCSFCHGEEPAYGAPMSLVRYEDFTAPSEDDPEVKLYELIKDRINRMGKGKMPDAARPDLTAAERATFNAWLDDGAPESDRSCGTSSGDGDGGTTSDLGKCNCEIDRTGLDCYKLTAHASESDLNSKYKVGSASDALLNFHFTAPWTGTVYGIVLRPIIDNKKVTHHWLLYQQPGGTGLKANGTVEDSLGTHPSGELVRSWAPGGDLIDFRKIDNGDIGFEFKEGDGFILELHYNSTDASATDASGVEICVDKEKPKNIAGVSWLGTDAIIGWRAQGTCDPVSNEPIRLLALSPHMHRKGKYLKSVINRADGTTEVLHDAPFAFSNQTWYATGQTLNAGDTITTRCDYQSTGTPGEAAPTFGTRTTDEMCYLFTVAYPKGALFNGDSAVHGGGNCLGSAIEGALCGAGSCIQ